MRAFVLRRLVAVPATVLVVVVLAFAIVRLAPGSPFSAERPVPAAVRAALEQRYGLDASVMTQLGRYLVGLARGDLGPSLRYPERSVAEVLAEGAPASALLALLALAWALFVGLAAGIVGAVRHRSGVDRAAMTLALVGVSVPSFVLGPLLVLLLSLTLYWLPPAGWGTWQHVILPAMTLGTAYAGQVARLTRAGLLEVVQAEFVRTARAKGLSARLVLWRHTLRLGLGPLVSALGPAAAQLVVGSVVVERIFATPGLGPYVVDAAMSRDYFLMMGIVIVEATLLSLFNLLVDVAQSLLDPRVRLS